MCVYQIQIQLMKTRYTIKQTLRNMAYAFLYAAGFGVVFAFGIIAMNSNLANSIAEEPSPKELQEEIMTIFGAEIEEATPSEDRKKTRRI